MKRSKITKNEQYIIMGMIGDGASHEEVAAELDRSVKAIIKFCDQQEVKPPSNDKTLFAKRPGISVMTKEESMRGDELRSKKNKSVNVGSKDSIHKIR